MGSEKKRKRRESKGAADPAVDAGADAAEAARKKAKKEAKAAKKAAKAAGAASPLASPAPASPPASPPAVAAAAAAAATAAPAADGLLDVAPLVSPIASPMAGDKLARRAHKLVEAAAGAKALRRGIKEVVLALRKGDEGLVFLAGDVFPVEVIAHLPLLCEEAGVPYCYVQRKSELGAAALTKRPTSVVLVSSKNAEKDLAKDIKECRKQLALIQTVF